MPALSELSHAEEVSPRTSHGVYRKSRNAWEQAEAKTRVRRIRGTRTNSFWFYRNKAPRTRKSIFNQLLSRQALTERRGKRH